MSLNLTPSTAAKLARLVYRIEKANYTEDDLAPFKKDWEFDLGAGSSRIAGVSGTARLIKSTSGFCSVAQGRNHYNGHLLILARGTNNAFDWATDLTIGCNRTNSGYLVHSGFNETFKSLLNLGLRSAVAPYLGMIFKVHVVGHSLGGALATLIAEWIHAQTGGSASVSLYTFGSPRVGLEPYSKHMESLLGTENIFRVYHQQDPVTWIPVWPFIHIPQTSYYRLGGAGSTFISPSAHFMETSYERIIETQYRNCNWQQLEDRAWTPPTQRAIEAWLRSDGVVSFCANTLGLLTAAIAWVFEKVCKALSIAIQLCLSGAITSLDLLAQLLENGMKSGGEAVGTNVKQLVKKIYQFNGRPVPADENINKVTIQLSFEEMQAKLNREVNSALMQAERRL